MRKLLLLVALCTFCISAHAQTMQEKLYYTGKVYGFVKYYHSEVSVCNVNWDSVTLAVLPDVRAAATSADFNDALMAMLNATGPMALSTTYFPDTLPAELKRNRDWGWISSSVLRADVRTILDTIKNNFRPHVGCWALNNTTSSGGWLKFPHDSMGFNTTSAYPGQDERLLLLFKYWNIMKYFNPYNYVLDVPWDTTLMHSVVPVATVNNSQDLYLRLLKIAKALDDAHVDGFTYSTAWQKPMGYYTPKIILKYTGGEYVVMRSLETGIVKGDVIISVDGHPVTYWEDSVRQYYSAGNESVFKRQMCYNLLHRTASFTPETIVIRDATGTLVTYTVTTASPSWSNPFWADPLYPVDSLKAVSWTTINCDIGYVNMGELQNSEINSMYAALRTKETIIFDLRNYPNGTAWGIANWMYADRWQFAKDMEPDVNYPGTYYWYYDYRGFPGNPDAYLGKVILLMDEGTQSQGEYSSMMLERIPGTIKVGSQTAGADGNVTYWNLCEDLAGGFTSMGIFYPNGDSTQRIGIVPDTVVYPTVVGIRQGRDEMLEKALKIAGCELAVPTGKTYMGRIAVYPNPANETVTIQLAHLQAKDVSITITDVAGRVMEEQHLGKVSGTMQQTLDISKLPGGLYLVNVRCAGQLYVTKLVKE